MKMSLNLLTMPLMLALILLHLLQYYFLRMLNKFRESKNDANRIGLVKARSEYKTMLRKCRYEYDREKTSRFVNAKY